MPSRRRPAFALLAVLAATALLAISGRVAIPMTPVPITLQTLAVTLAGAVLGARLGTVAVGLWLVAGAAGLPVLAEGGSGLARFSGPSAGYLFAFPIAAWAVGRMTERGAMRRFVSAAIAMLLGNLVCLALGGTWLALIAGIAAAWDGGVMPFLPGAGIKALTGAVIVRALSRRTAIPAFRAASAPPGRSWRRPSRRRRGGRS